MSEEPKIRKGLSPRRDPTCFQTLQDIVIPAGTILRNDKNGEYRAVLGGISAALVFEDIPGNLSSAARAVFKKVIA